MSPINHSFGIGPRDQQADLPHLSSHSKYTRAIYYAAICANAWPGGLSHGYTDGTRLYRQIHGYTNYRRGYILATIHRRLSTQLYGLLLYGYTD